MSAVLRELRARLYPPTHQEGTLLRSLLVRFRWRVVAARLHDPLPDAMPRGLDGMHSPTRCLRSPTHSPAAAPLRARCCTSRSGCTLCAPPGKTQGPSCRWVGPCSSSERAGRPACHPSACPPACRLPACRCSNKCDLCKALWEETRLLPMLSLLRKTTLSFFTKKCFF